LQAADVAVTALAQLALDALQLRAAALVVEFELGVAREANHRRLENGLTGEEERELRPDDVLEQHEGAWHVDRHQPREAGRPRDRRPPPPGQPRNPRQPQREVEA